MTWKMTRMKLILTLLSVSTSKSTGRSKNLSGMHGWIGSGYISTFKNNAALFFFLHA